MNRSSNYLVMIFCRLINQTIFAALVSFVHIFEISTAEMSAANSVQRGWKEFLSFSNVLFTFDKPKTSLCGKYLLMKTVHTEVCGQCFWANKIPFTPIIFKWRQKSKRLRNLLLAWVKPVFMWKLRIWRPVCGLPCCSVAQAAAKTYPVSDPLQGSPAVLWALFKVPRWGDWNIRVLTERHACIWDDTGEHFHTSNQPKTSNPT